MYVYLLSVRKLWSPSSTSAPPDDNGTSAQLNDSLMAIDPTDARTSGNAVADSFRAAVSMYPKSGSAGSKSTSERVGNCAVRL